MGVRENSVLISVVGDDKACRGSTREITVFKLDTLVARPRFCTTAKPCACS